MSSSAFSNKEPAITTDEVVPSPTSLSIDFETSTIILAAGCWISISFRIVAPSFVMVTSPTGETNILSIPRGPRLERTTSATSLAAVILFFCASLSLVSVVPSFKTTIGTCCCCCADIQFTYFIYIMPITIFIFFLLYFLILRASFHCLDKVSFLEYTLFHFQWRLLNMTELAFFLCHFLTLFSDSF